MKINNILLRAVTEKNTGPNSTMTILTRAPHKRSEFSIKDIPLLAGKEEILLDTLRESMLLVPWADLTAAIVMATSKILEQHILGDGSGASVECTR